MVGITSYGAYIPRFRLNRRVIAAALGWYNPGVLPGEKAVANYDEDSITMAVAAARDCLKGFSRENIGGLYFASTTMPYKERQNAGIAAGALNLREEIRTADFAGSLKAGINALLSACEAVKAGSAREIVVCAADTRLGKIAGFQEQMFGDGGAAFLIGKENVVAALEGFYSLSTDFADHRRGETDKFDRSWEERWVHEMGYIRLIPEAINGLLKKYNLKIGDFARVVYPCPYNREQAMIGKTLGIDPGKIQDNLMSTVGDTGAAYSLMMLAAALEEAKAGDRILVVGYGNGCDALYFQVTEEIGKIRDRMGIRGHLARRKELDNYEKYTVFRNLIPLEVGIRGEEIASTQLSTLYRERRSILSLVGVRCKKCRTPQFPVQQVCVNPECGAIDEMEEYCFADRKGVLFTYTGDHLAFSPHPPAIYGIVDFTGGGRYLFDLTDCELDSLQVGMPVEMSFRRKYADERRGIYTYFWKAVPQGEE